MAREFRREMPPAFRLSVETPRVGVQELPLEMGSPRFPAYDSTQMVDNVRSEMLLRKVTPEARYDHQLALGILARGIQRRPVMNAVTRSFVLPFADDDSAVFDWILVIEDQPSCAKLARAILEGDGHAVIVAATASAAIDQLRVAPPSLIILDLKLPDRDGLSLVSDIRAMARDVPIVALTACAMAGDRERGLMAGCDEYLIKPVDPRTLRHTVARFARAA